MDQGVGGSRSAGIPNQGNFEKGQAGRETQRGTSRGGPTSGPRMTCGFCGAANYMGDNCWKKGKDRKCYRCGSAKHLIAQCLHLSKEGNFPRTEESTSKPINAMGNRPKVPGRAYAMEH
ncbi:DNA-binding protein HEXBP-like [Coffea eugenioides]|uniref:DNA-binding protein HEXBP-like n=1 Tax=Coffea eugenioides TaxID=49369 RepID=UPI000F6059DA|nr:DNA-binding protein HEXBP-like [Coffea eugenioides]